VRSRALTAVSQRGLASPAFATFYRIGSLADLDPGNSLHDQQICQDRREIVALAETIAFQLDAVQIAVRLSNDSYLHAPSPKQL
jgi:hypothetical protein